MKRGIILALILMIGILSSVEVTQSQVKIVAKNIFNERVISQDKSQLVLEDLEIESLYGNNIYVVKSISENGFVLVAGSDDVYPVLGYSSQSGFDVNNIPPALNNLLENYNESISEIKESNIKATPEITASWNLYTANNYESDRNRDSAGPLITTLWNQCKYYNASCPDDIEGVDGHAHVGCVAIAMAQLMNYHNHPVRGTGTHSYVSDLYGEVSADFNSNNYNWDNMPNYLTDYNDDVAQLCFHTGVSVEMMYTPYSSGAFGTLVAPALTSFFGYKDSMHWKTYHSNPGFMFLDSLKIEIDNERPTIQQGLGVQNNHLFLCDGYDDDFLHYNWGWDGLFDGYYYPSNLNPRYSEYNEYLWALIGIEPDVITIADFEASTMYANITEPITFTDLSIDNPTSWSWTFENGIPASSYDQNPEDVTYYSSGIFPVTLTTSFDNVINHVEVTKVKYITITEDMSPVASFSLMDTLVSSQQDVQLLNNSYNLPDSYTWLLSSPNGTFANNSNCNSESPTVSFDQAGEYSITLQATNEHGTNSITKNIYVDGLSLPFFEDFELPFNNTKWHIENPDDSLSWDGCYYIDGLLNSAKSVHIRCDLYGDVGQRDGLISPPINFDGYEDVELSFTHAYSAIEGKQDSLIVYVSIDNGSYWNRVFSIAEDGTNNFLTTNVSEIGFIPKHFYQWSGIGIGSDIITIPLEEWIGNNGVRIKFECYNDNGNRIYLDNISITGNLTSIDSEEDDVMVASIIESSAYPNPFNPMNEATIEFSLKQNSHISVGVYNIKGQKVKTLSNKSYSKGHHDLKWDGSDRYGRTCSSGVYFYKISTDKESYSYKIILMK